MLQKHDHTHASHRIVVTMLVACLGGLLLGAPACARAADTWPALRINEWMADNFSAVKDPADHDYEDWFEIYNPTANYVDLTGWFVSDDPTVPLRYLIPTGHIISPFGYLLVWADGEPQQETNTRPDIHVNFSLSKNGESIVLTAPDHSVVDSVTFGPQFFDESQGRFPDGGPTITTQIRPSPNYGNFGPDVPPHLDRAFASGDHILLAITTIPEFFYTVEYKTNFAATNWAPAVTFYANSRSYIWADQSPTNSQRFYRAVRLDTGD